MNFENHSQLSREKPSSCLLNKLLRIELILLIAVCIFDPGDKLLGSKVPLFGLGWILFIFDIMANRKSVYVPLNMIMYLLLFILIPLVSIAYYFFTGSDFVNYDGYRYFKAYLFITVVPILYISKIDLIKPTIAIISSVSILSVIIMIICYFNASLAIIFDEVGRRYGMFFVGGRIWGRPFLPDVEGVYFYTSELIVFPIGYFTMKTFVSRGATKTIYGLLLVINIVVMYLNGTRNSIMASILVPIFIVYWYSKRKILVLCVIILISVFFMENLIVIKDSALSTDSQSNIEKFSFAEDYLSLFADVNVLLFGQGLGSYFHTTTRGYVSLTELTYFEFIRRFGLILSLVSFALLLYPLSKLRLKKYDSIHYLLIAYLFLLIMAFFNPLLMSSSGMLLLSLVLYKVFSFTSIQNKVSHQVPYRDQACVST